MDSSISRRALTAALPAMAALTLLPGAAFALNVGEARALIDKAIADVNRVINSGKSEPAMYKDFEQIFVRYADVRYIAQSALGPAGGARIRRSWAPTSRPSRATSRASTASGSASSSAARSRSRTRGR